MCQAYEAEKRYMQSSEEFCRREGHRAFHAGTPITDVPHYLPSSQDEWRKGWNWAQAGNPSSY